MKNILLEERGKIKRKQLNKGLKTIYLAASWVPTYIYRERGESALVDRIKVCVFQMPYGLLVDDGKSVDIPHMSFV